jgi:hypothetical protein
MNALEPKILKGPAIMTPPRGSTSSDTRTQITDLREIVISVGEKQNAMLATQQEQAGALNEILDILKGTLKEKGILQRLSAVEDGLKDVKTDLCEHIDQHQDEEKGRKDREVEDARDAKKRRWGFQDAIILAVVLLALEPVLTLVLRAIKVLP